MTDNDLPPIDPNLPETKDRYDNPIKVGDTVRSHDFPDRYTGKRDSKDDANSCYYEGIVAGISPVTTDGSGFPDCPRYAIRITRRVFAGNEVECDDRYVFPPLNGTPRSFGGECLGVELLEAS